MQKVSLEPLLCTHNKPTEVQVFIQRDGLMDLLYSRLPRRLFSIMLYNNALHLATGHFSEASPCVLYSLSLYSLYAINDARLYIVYTRHGQFSFHKRDPEIIGLDHLDVINAFFPFRSRNKTRAKGLCISGNMITYVHCTYLNET